MGDRANISSKTFGKGSETVSVVMGTYNGEKYLAEQLTSILNQTRPPDEVIVSDDASTDGTVRLVERLAQTAGSSLKLVKNETNRGYRANFERALHHATGDLVFFSDQDDIWISDKVERVAAHFQAHPSALLVYTDGFVFDDATGEKKLLSEWYGPLFRDDLSARDALRNVYGTHNLKGCLLAFRAELKAFALPFGAGWGHDRWLTLIGYALAAASCLDEPLILHRRHPNTTTYRDFFGQTQRTEQPQAAAGSPGLKKLVEPYLHGRGKRTSSSKYDYPSLLERLEAAQTSSLVAPNSAATLTAYLNRCRHLAKVAETRASVQQRSPVARLGAATRLLAGGYYHQNFDGVYSFVDDLKGRTT